MPDTYTLSFKNFRSLRDTKIDIAPLTVVYGPNGSGKSSILYGLLTLKNFLANPNQNMPSLFSYPSISLGGLGEVVYRHNRDVGVAISIGISNPRELSAEFTLTLQRSGGTVGMTFGKPEDTQLVLWPENLDLDIAVPYQSNQQVEEDISVVIPDPTFMPEECTGSLFWNGVGVSVNLHRDQRHHVEFTRAINERANLPFELARRAGFVPLRRGFSKPTYGMTGVTPALANEDEVASLLASHDERFRRYEVSGYIEKIANRRIDTPTQVGTSSFTIDSIPTSAGVPVSVVNEGFGINQLLYMLTVCLYSPFKIVAIEEPEIR